MHAHRGPSSLPELLTPREMALVDRSAILAGVPVEQLMADAGRVVARAVRARLSPCRTVVLCGPGNNGGDGVETARYLRTAGWPVAVAALSALRRRWNGVQVRFDPAEAARAELVIDAVFGAGLSRDVSPSVAEVLRAARRVVAVDVPSGLDGANGQIRGFARQAMLTVTFFRLKPGHLLLPGRDLCGETVLAQIGFPPGVLDSVRPRAFRNGPSLWQIPSPTLQGHKYSRGHVTVLGGSAMTGAARLAAMAARRGGAGMVTIAALARGAEIYRCGEPGTIVSEAALPELLGDARRRTWVCGPGLGAETARAALPVLLASGRQVVVDADALTICAGAPDRLRGATVLTPHAGEFCRVFGDAGADRPEAARQAAALTGAVVLLKGRDTVIAAPDGRVAINDFRAAVARDGGFRGHSCGTDRGDAGAGDASLGGGGRGGLDARTGCLCRGAAPGGGGLAWCDRRGTNLGTSARGSVSPAGITAVRLNRLGLRNSAAPQCERGSGAVTELDVVVVRRRRCWRIGSCGDIAKCFYGSNALRRKGSQQRADALGTRSPAAGLNSTRLIQLYGRVGA